MNRTILIPLSILLVVVMACTDTASSNGNDAAQADTLSQAKVQLPAYNCAALGSKDTLYAIANRILQAGGQEYIWNLSDLDTGNYFTIEDHFLSTNAMERLVWIAGEAGGSAGTACNLLLLLSCTDSLRVLAAEQVGDITLADIRDLDGDGVKEIVSQSAFTWMGECGENYSIVHYKNGLRKALYQARSFSLLNCGLDSLYDHIQGGDTVEAQLNAKLLQQEGGRYAVQQTRTVKIHDGGANYTEVKKNLIVRTDTAIVEIK